MNQSLNTSLLNSNSKGKEIILKSEPYFLGSILVGVYQNGNEISAFVCDMKTWSNTIELKKIVTNILKSMGGLQNETN